MNSSIRKRKREERREEEEENQGQCASIILLINTNMFEYNKKLIETLLSFFFFFFFLGGFPIMYPQSFQPETIHCSRLIGPSGVNHWSREFFQSAGLGLELGAHPNPTIVELLKYP